MVPRTMGIVALLVVARSAGLAAFELREAVADRDGVARRATVRRRVCSNDTQERATKRR